MSRPVKAPEAKPCPFCGSGATYIECLGGVFACTFARRCDECGAQGPSVEDANYGDGRDRETRDATIAWNKRRAALAARGGEQ